MPPQRTRRISRLARHHRNSIRIYRLAVGLTQRALAKALGVSASTISGWERGTRPGPVPAVLMRLARTLNTLSEHLYRDDFWPTDQENSPAQPASR